MVDKPILLYLPRKICSVLDETWLMKKYLNEMFST